MARFDIAEPNIPTFEDLRKPQIPTFEELRPKAASPTFNLTTDQQLELVKAMRGALPLSQQPRTDLPIQRETMLLDPQRQKAFDALLKSGITKDQIQQVQDIERRISPGLIGQIKKDIGEDVGGTIGGIAAGFALSKIIPGPIDDIALANLVIRGLGATVGGGVGKIMQQAISPYESPSARDFVRSAVRQGLYEDIGLFASKALKFTPLYKKPVKEVAELEMSPSQIAQIFKSRGGFFMPKQRDRRLLVGAFEQLSRGSFGGGGVFDAFDKSQAAQAVETAIVIANSLADDALKTPERLGNELFDIFVRSGEKGIKFKGRRQALLDEFFDVLYRHVGELSPDIELSTQPIKKFMEQKLAEDLAAGGALLTSEGRSKFRYSLKNLEDTRNLRQFIDLRSSYLKDARKFAVDADKSEAVFAQLAEVADRALFDPTTSSRMSPEANTFLRNVNAVYGPSKLLYDETFIRRIISRVGDSPTEVLNVIYADYDPARLKRIREILVNPVRKTTGVGTTEKSIADELRTLRRSLSGIKGSEQVVSLLSENAAEGRMLWKQLNAVWFAQQVSDAFDPATQMMNIRKLTRTIGEIPPESFKLMFPGTKGVAVNDVIKLFNVIAPPKRGFVSMFGKAIEIGAAYEMAEPIKALATGGDILGGAISVTARGTLAISPYIFAKAATNPKWTKLLTLGLKAPAGSIKIAPIAARLINLLNEDILRDQKAILEERKKQARRERRLPLAEIRPSIGELTRMGP